MVGIGHDIQATVAMIANGRRHRFEKTNELLAPYGPEVLMVLQESVQLVDEGLVVPGMMDRRCSCNDLWFQRLIAIRRLA
ncbi:MAG: hypothetical protein PVH30_12105 [Desulfobacterales bacterium]